MEGVEGTPDLFSKIGPLPAWAWGAIAVGGYLFYTHRQASTATPASDTLDTGYGSENANGTTTDYGSTADSMLSGSDASYNYADTLTGGYTGTTGGTAYASNQAWSVAAIETLINAGVPASVAASGITHYLAGANLSSAEAAAVTQAISLIGPPPLPLPFNTGTGSTTDTGGGTPPPTVDSGNPPPTPTPTGGGTVSKAKASIHLSLSKSTVKVGESFTATVTASGAHGKPTGVVGLSLNQQRANLENGKATFTVTLHEKQSTKFDAGYEGDATYEYGGSNYVTVNVV